MEGTIYFKKITSLVNTLTFELYQCFEPYYSKMTSFSENNRFIITALHNQLFDTSESALILIKKEKLFDAEMLLRTVIEGTIKLVYLMQLDLTIDNDEMKQFFVDLPEANKVSAHNKALNVLNYYKKYDNRPHPFETVLLDEKQLTELKQKYPKNIRNNLEQSWSLSSLLLKLEKLDKNNSVFLGFFYQYFSSSHYVHFDAESIIDRFQSLKSLVDNPGNNLFYGFGLRILSNLLLCSIMRCIYFGRIVGNTSESNKFINRGLNIIKMIDDFNHEKMDDELIKMRIMFDEI